MKLDSDTPTVLLPIETTSRELDSKLIVASFLASRGCRAIVGHKEAINFIGASSKRTVWQGKDAFSLASPPTATDHVADRLQAGGSAVMFIQDEGGIFPANGWTQTLLAKHRANYIRERRLSRVCVWGERQKEALTENGVAPGEVIAITGCPRFDLCSPRFDWIRDAAVARALSSHRPYILMCTRFTSVVHAEGQDRIFRPPDALTTPQGADLRLSAWQRDVHDFADYVVLVKEIAAAYPDFDVIVRPHPSENALFYRHVFLQTGNVTVENEGSVLDWIRSAELVIHTNCTTGVEAVLAGRRVINMLPDAVPRDNLDKEVAKEAGVTVRSIPEAVETAGALLRAPAPAQTWSAGAHAMLANLTMDAVPVLANETLKILREEGIDSSRVVLPPNRPLRNFARRILKRGATSSYVMAKRGQLDAEHIEKVVGDYRPEGGGRGRIRKLSATYVVVEPN